MIDNGLLKKYFEEKNAEKMFGFNVLDVEKIPQVTQEVLAIKNNSKSGVGRYFFKEYPIYKLTMDGRIHPGHIQMDAEILLSQVYAKAGLKSAIYIPVALRDGKTKICDDDYVVPGVISNDILGNAPTTREGDIRKHYAGTFDSWNDFAKQNMYECGIHRIRDNGRFYKNFVLHSKKRCDVEDITKYFSPNAARQLIKARLFDVASFNSDRHTGNMFLQFSGGKAENVLFFDYGFSGSEYHMNSTDIYGDAVYYYNEFCYATMQNGDAYIGFKDRHEMVENFKHNETMQEFITTQELAEELEKVDVKETARDIKDTIGYEFNEKYVNKVAESFERLREEIEDER